MYLITDQESFNNARSRALVTVECPVCTKPFGRAKHYVQSDLKRERTVACSKVCQTARALKPRHHFTCQQCGNPVERKDGDITSRANKGLIHHFCTQRCAGIYNAAHRKSGGRRAKLEIWLEEQLVSLYPNLTILYNDTSAIKAELDIYIPSLKLGVELNGVFHYEPIFGEKKLYDTKQRDVNKFAACQKAGISLCVIDTSKAIYHKPKTAQPFLDIIVRVINERLTEGIG